MRPPKTSRPGKRGRKTLLPPGPVTPAGPTRPQDESRKACALPRETCDRNLPLPGLWWLPRFPPVRLLHCRPRPDTPEKPHLSPPLRLSRPPLPTPHAASHSSSSVDTTPARRPAPRSTSPPLFFRAGAPAPCTGCS